MLYGELRIERLILESTGTVGFERLRIIAEGMTERLVVSSEDGK